MIYKIVTGAMNKGRPKYDINQTAVYYYLFSFIFRAPERGSRVRRCP